MPLSLALNRMINAYGRLHIAINNSDNSSGGNTDVSRGLMPVRGKKQIGLHFCRDRINCQYAALTVETALFPVLVKPDDKLSGVIALDPHFLRQVQKMQVLCDRVIDTILTAKKIKITLDDRNLSALTVMQHLRSTIMSSGVPR